LAFEYEDSEAEAEADAAAAALCHFGDFDKTSKVWVD